MMPVAYVCADQMAPVFGLTASDGVAACLRFRPRAAPVHMDRNGVESGRFNPAVAPRYPAEPGTVVVGYAGTFKPWHGVGELVEAFVELHEAFPQTRLLLVGDGPRLPDVLTKLEAQGLGEVARATGAVPPEEVPSLLASMDVAVAPYAQTGAQNSSRLKLFEYMAAGRAIVASRTSAVARVLRHEETALLCAPGNARALSVALASLVLKPALRRRLGAAARAQAVARYSRDAVAAPVPDMASTLVTSTALACKAD